METNNSNQDKKETSETKSEKLEKPVPRETEQRCENCKFFDRKRGCDYGSCRRFPPNSGYADRKTFTEVKLEMWCGEYKEC